MRKLASFLFITLACLSTAVSMDVYISFDETHFTEEVLEEYPEYYFRCNTFRKLMEKLGPQNINLVNCDRIKYPYFNFSDRQCELRTSLNEKKTLQLSGLHSLGFAREQDEFYDMTREELDRTVDSVSLALESFLYSNLMSKKSEEKSPYLVDAIEVDNPFTELPGATGQIAAFDDYSFAIIYYSVYFHISSFQTSSSQCPLEYPHASHFQSPKEKT